MGIKFGFAGWEMVISASTVDAEIRRNMGLSALGPLAILPFRSGAANQNAVSDCALSKDVKQINNPTNSKRFIVIAVGLYNQQIVSGHCGVQ